MSSRPDPKSLIGKDVKDVPMSCQRILEASSSVEPLWIGPGEAKALPKEDLKAYELAHTIMCHLAIQAPTKHASGHPGGPLSSFTFAYFLSKRRNPALDQPLRMSAGHLSVLAYGLQWLFGREGNDPRLQSPQTIIDTFRTPSGLPGHVEAGIGDIPFGSGPLGKGVSNALGAAFGLKYLKKPGVVDVLLADGDCQEGQVMEAFRLASHLKLGNLVVHGDFNDIQLSDMPSKIVAADFAQIAAAAGWRVIEVQNGNDPGQVIAALELADAFSPSRREGVRGRGSDARRESQAIQKIVGTPSPQSSPAGGGSPRPTFICYYTTMGHGVKVMEEGSNTGKENFHGTPLKPEVAEEALKLLPPLEELVEAYEPYRRKEKARYAASPRIKTDLLLPWSIEELKRQGYKRTVTTEKGAARQEFGSVHLKNLMKADSRIIVLHADLAGSGGFDKVAREFSPSASSAPCVMVSGVESTHRELGCSGQAPRVINVGVAEANMVMMAAGMRQVGLLPVTYTFAAFGTNEARANARLIDINCGHTRCGIINDCTHAGVNVGEDGETHQEQNYLNLPFRHTQVWMPADSNQAGAAAQRALELIAEGHTSVFTFFPRSGHEQLKNAKGELIYGESYTFDGTATLLRGKGDLTDQLTIIATGPCVHDAVAAADLLTNSKLKAQSSKLSIRVLNIACIRPLDAAAIIQAALETAHLVVVEDHNIEGGIATQVADVIADFTLPCSLRRLGLNHYFPSGTAKDLKLMAGIDSESIVDAVHDEMTVEVRGGEDALLTSLFQLSHNLSLSRFREGALLFIEKLKHEKDYLDALRAAWKKRSCDSSNLPRTQDLLAQLP